MRYRISAASYPGAGHQARGEECQDRFHICRESGVICAALADGAGSRSQSGLGAQLVTETVSRLLCREFRRFWTMDKEELAGELLEACRQELAQQEVPLREMACTLLYFAADQTGCYLAGHLGDGVQVLVKGGEARLFSPPENGDQPNETVFVTSGGAREHFRIQKGMLPRRGAMLLMSDGAAQSLYQSATQTPAPACASVAQWLKKDDEETISRALEENLRTVLSRHTKDDMSLVIVRWTDWLWW